MNSSSSGLRMSLVFLTAPGLPSADGPEIAGKLMSISLVVAHIKNALPPTPTLPSEHSTPVRDALVVLY